MFWKHNTFLAVYCTLGIYLKTKKMHSEEFDATELRRARASLETIDLRALEFGPD